MATIIAGRLQLQNQADEVIAQLVKSGIAPDKIASFYVNPPGQHSRYPIGGDRYESPTAPDSNEAKHSKLGRAIDEATETLAEAVIGYDSHGKPHHHDHMAHIRKAGMLVAAQTDAISQDTMVKLLAQLGATDIEKADGEITDGEWLDFDPLNEPMYL